jgi:hypothetical protein
VDDMIGMKLVEGLADLSKDMGYFILRESMIFF